MSLQLKQPNTQNSDENGNKNRLRNIKDNGFAWNYFIPVQA